MAIASCEFGCDSDNRCLRQDGDGLVPRCIARARRCREADAADLMIETLEEARLQIEYLHGKFKETSSGNGVLAKIAHALAAAKGEP